MLTFFWPTDWGYGHIYIYIYYTHVYTEIPYQHILSQSFSNWVPDNWVYRFPKLFPAFPKVLISPNHFLLNFWDALTEPRHVGPVQCSPAPKLGHFGPEKNIFSPPLPLQIPQFSADTLPAPLPLSLLETPLLGFSIKIENPPPPAASDSPFPLPEQKKIKNIRNVHQEK